MQLSFSPAEIEALVKPLRTAGSTDASIAGIASLESAGPGDLAFLANPKYRDQVAACRASLVLLPADFEGDPAANQRWLFLEDPSVALTRICVAVESLIRPKPAPGVHPSAVVDPSAKIAASAHVGALCIVEEGATIGDGAVLEGGVFVGRGATIGADCWICPRCVVASMCVLGKRVRLQPGVIVGGDGFGYNTVDGRHEKIPQLGVVLIGDDVEIGANSTIDRARFSKTEIGEGTKIDNLVQVAHNVVIGRYCLIVAQVGISGSTTIGDNVIIGGQAGLAGHIKVGDNTKIGGQAGVARDTEPGTAIWGSPAMPMLAAKRLAAVQERIPELFRRVGKIEEALGLGKNPST